MQSTRYLSGRRVILVSIGVNLALFALKLPAGIFGRSQALVADAAHTLGDILSSLAVLVGLRFGSRPADGGHPYGHGKFETMATAGLALLLCAIGAAFLYRALVQLLAPAVIPVPGRWPLLAAAVSIVVKELLYRYAIRTAGLIRSGALAADAWHHRWDALTSLPALCGVLGARYGLPLMDPLMTAVIAVMVTRVGLGMLAGAFHELVEGSVEEAVLREVRARALEVAGVRCVHDLRGRRCGPEISLEMHILVDGSINVQAGHRIADEVEHRLKGGVTGVARVTVHVDPEGRRT